MRNAFNECNAVTMPFAGVLEYFPGISAWVKGSYSQPAELYFGKKRLVTSSEVYNKWSSGGPLLFYLVILQFIDAVLCCDLVKLSIWYLDDGTFVGNYSSLDSSFSLYFKRSRILSSSWFIQMCNFRSSGDVSFSDIKWVAIGGLELLGSPLWGPDALFSKFCRIKCLEEAFFLEDPQVELRLLW